MAIQSPAIGSISVTAADGSILDGVTTSIKATVKDYTNSNPLMVAVSDANGDIITSFPVTGTFWQATQPISGTVTANAGTGTFIVGDAGAIINLDASGDVQADVLTIAAGDNNIGNVDIASALPAGTNAIGKLAANSGIDIGDVDVTSMAHGKTIKTVTGTVSVDTDIVAAVATKRIKVIAYSLISASTTSNTITFQSNASTALWTIPLQALSGTIVGANLAIAAPSFLFATTAGEKLTLDVSAAVNITYGVSYYDDDST